MKKNSKVASTKDLNIDNDLSKAEIIPYLPKDLFKYQIFPYLSMKDLRVLDHTSKPLHYVLSKEMGPFRQAKVNRLLQYVVQGKKEKAKAMLKTDASLLFEKGEVTDYSGRNFKNISVLQYPAWAYDMDMLDMISEFIPKALRQKAYEQLNELDEKGTIHGPHYDFNYIDALETYVKNHNILNENQRINYWCKVVGKAQAKAVVHLANELCQENLSDLKDKKKELSRVLFIQDCTIDSHKEPVFFWFPLTSLGLGETFGIARGPKGKLPNACTSYYPLLKYAEADLETIKTLRDVRKEGYQNFKKSLRRDIDPNHCCVM